MNWKEFKEKVDRLAEKKKIPSESLNVEFIYFTGLQPKSRMSILKRGKTKVKKDGLTHDLFVD